MSYTPVAQRSPTKKLGYVPVAERPVVSPLSLQDIRARGETISAAPPSLTQRIAQALPEKAGRTFEFVANHIKEGLFGSAQDKEFLRRLEEQGKKPSDVIQRIATLGFTGNKGEGLLPIFGRSQTDQVEHRAMEHEKKGVAPERATELAFYEVFSKGGFRLGAEGVKLQEQARQRLAALKPTEQEKSTARLATLGQTIGGGLDVAGVLPIGSISKVSKVPKALMGLAEEAKKYKSAEEFVKAQTKSNSWSEAQKTNPDLWNKGILRRSLSPVDAKGVIPKDVHTIQGKWQNYGQNSEIPADIIYERVNSGAFKGSYNDKQGFPVRDSKTGKILEDIYDDATGEWIKPEVSSQQLKESLLKEFETPEGKKYLNEVINALPKNPDGTVTAYRIGSIGEGAQSYTLSEGMAKTFSNQGTDIPLPGTPGLPKGGYKDFGALPANMVKIDPKGIKAWSPYDAEILVEPKYVKTKSQLTDFYNQAVAKRAYTPVAERTGVLEDMRQEIAVRKDTLGDMPGKQLLKYVSRETGELPEMGKTTANKGVSKSVFAQKGDVIFQDLVGQELSQGGDVVVAQEMVDAYKKSKLKLDNLQKEYRQAKLANRDEKVLNAMSEKIGKENEKLQAQRLAQKKLETASSQPRRQGISQETGSPQAKQTPSLDGTVADSAGKINDKIYADNRTKVAQKESRIQRIKDSVSAALHSLGQGADRIFGSISTRLKNIDPSLKRAIRDFEFSLAGKTQADYKSVAPFLRSIRSKNISSADYADLDLALKNGDLAKTSELISKYGLEAEFNAVRNTLESLYKRADDVGYDIGYEKNYFPRMIEDSTGFLEYIQKGDDWSIIDEAIKLKEAELARYLTVDEKAALINTLVRGYKSGKITLSETGAMKARTVDVVDAGLNQFYRDSVSSLLRYIDSTNNAIEARRFFGQSKKADQFANIEDSIGTYVLNLLADGKIKPSQERELRDILQARFAPKEMHGILSTYKNLAYIDTMGSFTSAITQLGDLAFALYKAGPVQTVKALGKAIVGRSEITRADIGIDKIAQEFQDGGTSGKAVTRVFKLIGLEKFDSLGKETVINGVIGRFRKLAQNPTDDFLRRMEAIFSPEDVPRVLEELKSGEVTEDIKLIAFNELLDVQPVALSEMPEQYLKGGNGRIFYMLKTYTVKLFDVYRNEIFQEMARNPVQGMKNLLYLSGALVAMNATADEIKDLMLNRETSLKDRTIDNILRLVGFSKFTLYKAREEGVGSAIVQTILPPIKFADSLSKDITKGEVAETVQSIPIGGKLYYWWFGKGAEKTEKKRNVGTTSSKKMKTPAGLPELPTLKKRLPTLPGLPKLPS